LGVREEQGCGGKGERGERWRQRKGRGWRRGEEDGLMTVWIGILADGYFCRGNYCFALVLVTGGSRNPWVF